MKYLAYTGLSLFAFLLLTVCEKTHETSTDPFFTDLHDTLLYAEWANGADTFYFDVDKDSTRDIMIHVSSYYSSFAGSESYIRIMPLHDFEIAFSKIATTSWYWNPDLPDTVFTTDTVMIPEVFYPGDTIRMDDHFTSAPLVIGYFRSPGFPGEAYNSEVQYGIHVPEETFFYFGLRNIRDPLSRLAWVREKDPANQSGIILNSCRYLDTNYLMVIE